MSEEMEENMDTLVDTASEISTDCGNNDDTKDYLAIHTEVRSGKRKRSVPFKLKESAAEIPAPKPAQIPATKPPPRVTTKKIVVAKKTIVEDTSLDTFSSIDEAFVQSYLDNNATSSSSFTRIEQIRNDQGEVENIPVQVQVTDAVAQSLKNSGVNEIVDDGVNQMIRKLKVNSRTLECNEVANIVRYAASEETLNKLLFTFICCLALNAVHSEDRGKEDDLNIMYAIEYKNVYNECSTIQEWVDRLFSNLPCSGTRQKWPLHFQQYSAEKVACKEGKQAAEYREKHGNSSNAQIYQFGYNVHQIASLAKKEINNNCNKLARDLKSGENKTQVLEAVR